MLTPSYKLWTVVSIALLALCTALAVVLGNDVRLISLLVLPPLVAGLSTTPRRTALVTAMSIAAAIALGLDRDGYFMSTSHILRLVLVILAAALAVQTSILRERDQRTRRRLNLINAARDQLEAASGVEDALASFCRAAINADFAEWAILDLRLPDGTNVRIVEQAEAGEALDVVVLEETTPASASFALEAERGGPTLMRDTPRSLIDGLLAGPALDQLQHVNTMIKSVTVGELSAVYFLICPHPHPPWGEAEVTQVASLARAAAQRARSDQLIDRITHAQGELRESRDEIAAIVGGIASGIIAQRPDGEIVYANDVAAQMLDWENAEAMIGAKFQAVLDGIEMRHEDGRPFAPDEIPSRRALRGDEHPTALFRYIVKRTGEERWMFVRSTAIFSERGEPVLAIAVIEDNTKRKRNEMSQRFLADASKQLTASLDFDSAVEQLARSAVPAIADWCSVEMLEPDGSIATVAVAHADLELEQKLRAYRDRYPISADDEFGPAQAIRSGESTLYSQDQIAHAPDIYNDDERAKAVWEFAPRSALTVPISVRGKPIGAIVLTLSRPGARFTQYDLDTVTELGRRAGIALDNARMHTERMRMLSSLQKSLIPAELPVLPGLELSAAFRPAERDAEVGGDFYDAFNLADGSSALVIGDVCGKGPEAAALTALARYTIRSIAMSESDPRQILEQLNAALIEQVTDGRFCTVAFVRVEPRDGGLSVQAISAGHPLPVVMSPSGPRSIGTPGTLLGVVEAPELPTESAVIGPEEALMLYTDGLSAGQTTDDTDYALKLVGGLSLNGTRELAATVDAAAVSQQAEPNRDDTAILVARPTG